MDGGWGWEGNGLVPAATGGHSITLLLLIWVTSSLSLSLSPLFVFGEQGINQTLAMGMTGIALLF